MVEPVHYYERQSVGPLFYGTAIVVGVAGLLLFAPGIAGNLRPLHGITGFILMTVSVLALNVFTMSTWVYDDRIKVQFGRLIPYWPLIIKLDSVTRVRTVEYDPAESVNGWGISQGTFDSESMRFVHASGRHGVLVELRDKRLIIGTQFPRELEEAIQRRVRDLAPS